MVYALLPMVCGGMLCLFLLVRTVGESEIKDTFFAIGDKSVFAIVGAVPVMEDPPALPSVEENAVPDAMPEKVQNAPEEEIAPQKTPEIFYDSLPAGATPIIACDLSSQSYFINTTKYTIDLDKAQSAPFPSSRAIPENGPLVLVLHTHATESYFEDRTNLSQFADGGVESYFLQSEVSFRTTDPEKSVVKVGEVFCQTLESLGIPTLHCTVMHDKDDFNSAYINSAETVKAMLKQYPTIQYVIDLHRDSVVRGESYVKSSTVLNGTPSAQVMLVVGTNQNGRHPNWEQNLTVACAFKNKMDALFPSLSRALYLRTARFNQEFLPGCMLLEVGSCANTLEEAENAAISAAHAFSAMIRE